MNKIIKKYGFVVPLVFLFSCAERKELTMNDFEMNSAILCRIGNQCYQDISSSKISYELKKENNNYILEGSIMVDIPAVNLSSRSLLRFYFLDAQKRPVCSKNISTFGRTGSDMKSDFLSKVCKDKDIEFSVISGLNIQGYDGFHSTTYKTTVIK